MRLNLESEKDYYDEEYADEEDEDGHLSCLLITQDLLNKDSEGLFLEQFAKLGLFSKVRKKEMDENLAPPTCTYTSTTSFIIQ